MSAQPAPAAPPFHRPLGVAILAILIMIVGAIIAIAGLAILVVGGLGGFLLLGPIVGAIGAVAGLIVLIVGAITFIAGSGLWKMRGWAWWLAMIILVIDVIAGLGTGIGWILPAILVLYLLVVRKHFNT